MAIERALAGRQAERAADLIEREWERTFLYGGNRTVERWLWALPPELIRTRPPLSLAPATIHIRQCHVAAQLFVSVGTVKGHFHQIYGKLDAASRSSAVAHARDLGLL